MFSIFNKNKRNLKKLKSEVSKIKAFENKHSQLSDSEIREQFLSYKNTEINLDKILPEIFSLVKEATKRTLGFNTYDVQLKGGIVLHQGNIAEMKTGEGKTLIAVAPASLNALKHSVNIVTVNDYLAERDANIMRPIYEFLGLSVGIVTARTFEKQAEYEKDIVYVTNSELTFDYLRDNLVHIKEEQVLNKKYFAIIDEVDSILIDEARNPLIISDNVEGHNVEHYMKAFEIAQQLEKGEEIKDKHGKVESIKGDFITDIKNKGIFLTEQGITKVEKLLNIKNLYDKEHVFFSHFITQSLVAMYSYTKDVDYIVREDQVFIIDENTGRVSEGRRYSEGLHQAIETKEGLEPKPESQTVASTSYQNFFKLFDKIAGMTGTAQTEATEFWEIYKLEVISIPTHKPIQRKDLSDLIFFSEKEKLEAILEKVISLNSEGQPVLIGTTSIEKSEQLHELFVKNKIKHEILNAKNHYREAEIIQLAGQKGAITIATNMAGRGVDIKVPEESLALGGLYIIGSERHPSRRIDNQLRGRSGRQGDVGTTQFYLSLEDELLLKFGGDKIQAISKFLKPTYGECIESSLLSKTIEKSQKKIEQMHYEYRKNIVEYDNVNNEQRKVIYDIRQQILEKRFNIDEKTENYLNEYMNNVAFKIISEADNKPEEVKNLSIDFMRNTFFIDTVDFFRNLNDEELDNLSNILSSILVDSFMDNINKVNLQAERVSELRRYILLQILDKSWKEHLHQLDILSTGIGLRGYNQKDPLIEYKKESYNMFQELMENIKNEYIETLYKLYFHTEREEDFEENNNIITNEDA